MASRWSIKNKMVEKKVHKRKPTKEENPEKWAEIDEVIRFKVHLICVIRIRLVYGNISVHKEAHNIYIIYILTITFGKANVMLSISKWMIPFICNKTFFFLDTQKILKSENFIKPIQLRKFNNLTFTGFNMMCGYIERLILYC